MTDIEKSPNWDARKDSVGRIDEGFPFDEGFPRNAFNDSAKEYSLIFVDGTRLTGRPDYSRMYMSEGIEWEIKPPSEFRGLARHVIAAWCENQTPEPEQ